MIWILPINLPVLVVWVRNLAVQWLTPFSSHHNILSIVPFILLIETAATGKMVPRLQSRLRYVTFSCLFTLAFFAAIYGVSYAYALHQGANIFCAWLVLVLWYSGRRELEQVIDNVVSGQDDKKQPWILNDVYHMAIWNVFFSSICFNDTPITFSFFKSRILGSCHVPLQVWMTCIVSPFIFASFQSMELRRVFWNGGSHIVNWPPKWMNDIHGTLLVPVILSRAYWM